MNKNWPSGQRATKSIKTKKYDGSLYNLFLVMTVTDISLR